jgi:hypothetical protein
MERVKITDSTGKELDLEALRGEAGEQEHDHG